MTNKNNSWKWASAFAFAGALLSIPAYLETADITNIVNGIILVIAFIVIPYNPFINDRYSNV